MHAHLHAHAHASMHGLVHACMHDLMHAHMCVNGYAFSSATRQEYNLTILPQILSVLPRVRMRPQIHIDVHAVSGKVLLQSFPVDDAIFGQDLIFLVKKHLGNMKQSASCFTNTIPSSPWLDLRIKISPNAHS